MGSKSDFLEGLRLLVGRSEMDESEKERLLALLTEARFSTASIEDLNKIATVVESEKASLETEIAESSDPDMINEMSDVIEALDKIDYDAATTAFDQMGVENDGSSQVSNKSGQWLLDKFAGIESSGGSTEETTT